MSQTSEEQLVDLIRALSESIKKEIEVKIPCIVTSVTSRKKVTVRPLIKIVGKDGQTYSRDVIEGVPVFFYGAGDKLISFPIKVGDKGWLEASDRDLSLFLQSFDETEPPTKRLHSFSDSLFVPDIFENYSISEEDADAVVVQNLDGSVKIALDDDTVRVVNDSVNLTVTNNSVSGIAPGGFNLNGFIINADGSVSSPVSVSAPNVIAAASLTVANVEVGGHAHSGVATGSDSTNPMGS